MTEEALAQYRPMAAAMREVAEALLGLMQGLLKGEVAEEEYRRLFGTKDGMVVQLQKLCALVQEIRELEQLSAPPAEAVEVAEVDRYERELIAHYLHAYRTQAASADDASSE